MSIDKESIISGIYNLSQEQFYKYLYKVLKLEYEDLELFRSNDDCCRCSNNNNQYMQEMDMFFIFEYLPYELFYNPKDIPFDNPRLRKKLQSIKDYERHFLWLYGCRQFVESTTGGIFYFNNIVGPERGFFVDYALGIYQEIMKELGMILHIFDDIRPTIGIGHPRNIVERNFPVASRVLHEIGRESGYVTIEFGESGYEVNNGISGKYISSGVTRSSREIIYPSVITRSEEVVAREFENLLNENVSEKRIQEFIMSYYSQIFGNKYDQIRAEVSLKYPELDISQKNRRIDLFAHNQIIDDWEIIELKKNVRLLSNYRDIKKFSSEITGAIEQLRNYYHILQQQTVKDSFRREGIEYYDPSLKLIFGGKIDTNSRAEWRRLVKTVPDVKLITYDELIAELRLR